jgi:hypothetical protein
MTGQVLARRTFTPADQRMFAEASGDFNPIHIDPAAARRTQAGQLVVHGVHAMIWGLETAAAAEMLDRPVSSVRTVFQRFILVGQAVSVRCLREETPNAGELRLDLENDGSSFATITVQFSSSDVRDETALADAPETSIGRDPLSPPVDEMDGSRGWVSPATLAETLANQFPALARVLEARRVTGLALMSTVVGMACPGRHSIFTSLHARVDTAESDRPGLGWEARRPDRRYLRIDLTLAGSGWQAEARALVRPAPVEPAGFEGLSRDVDPTEFSGRRAVVIGGSRGLGAVTAKLLAAGGAHVLITFAVGQDEAMAVAADISRHRGTDVAAIARCDVLEAFGEPLALALRSATHVYYFATPHISRPRSGVFSDEAFGDFIQTYVTRFYDLCCLALDRAGDQPLSILYPSSVAVTDRPRGMTEYAMAKAAGEVLCQDLARSDPRLAISMPRLPRVLTDQTALSIPVRAETPQAVMLPLLRAEPRA